jgi:ketosteroid isomerase-like protein
MTKSEIAQAFSHGDFEKCFAYLIDQTTWDTPGEQMLKGRDEIESLCQNVKAYFYSVTTNFQQINLIESANCVAINGTAEFIRDAKRVSFVYSCDVYVFDANNSIASITSYCITDKSSAN